jgi:hypothetical protein
MPCHGGIEQNIQGKNYEETALGGLLSLKPNQPHGNALQKAMPATVGLDLNSGHGSQGYRLAAMADYVDHPIMWT